MFLFIFSYELTAIVKCVQVAFFRALRNVVENRCLNAFVSRNVHDFVNYAYRNYVCGHVVFDYLYCALEDWKLVDLVSLCYFLWNLDC